MLVTSTRYQLTAIFFLNGDVRWRVFSFLFFYPTYREVCHHGYEKTNGQMGGEVMGGGGGFSSGGNVVILSTGNFKRVD